jgi:hypothetical protein
VKYRKNGIASARRIVSEVAPTSSPMPMKAEMIPITPNTVAIPKPKSLAALYSLVLI